MPTLLYEAFGVSATLYGPAGNPPMKPLTMGSPESHSPPCTRLKPNGLPSYPPGIALCDAVGADPWGMLASGTLLASFSAASADAAVSALTADGYAVASLAVAEPGAGVTLKDDRPLPRYERDELSRILTGA